MHANVNLVFDTYIARCTARILVGVGVQRFVEKPDHERCILKFCSIRQITPWSYAYLCIHSGCVFDIFFLYLRKGDKLFRKKSCSSKVRKGRIYKVFLPFCISLQTSWHIIWLSCLGALMLVLATLAVPIGVIMVAWLLVLIGVLPADVAAKVSFIVILCALAPVGGRLGRSQD